MIRKCTTQSSYWKYITVGCDDDVGKTVFEVPLSPMLPLTKYQIWKPLQGAKLGNLAKCNIWELCSVKSLLYAHNMETLECGSLIGNLAMRNILNPARSAFGPCKLQCALFRTQQDAKFRKLENAATLQD